MAGSVAAYGGSGRNVIVLVKEGWERGDRGIGRFEARRALLSAGDRACRGWRYRHQRFDAFDLTIPSACRLSWMRRFVGYYFFGGHQAAAGMTLAVTRVEALTDRLHKIAGQRLSEEDWAAETARRSDDRDARRDDRSRRRTRELGAVRLWQSDSSSCHERCRYPGKPDNGERGSASSRDRRGRPLLEAVAFGMGNQRERLAPGVRIDILGELSVNEWNGNRKVQIVCMLGRLSVRASARERPPRRERAVGRFVSRIARFLF